jgi:hypothetical protein
VNRFSFAGVATVVVPLTCVLGMGVLVYMQYLRMRGIEDERAQTEANIRIVEGSLQRIMESPPPPRRPAEFRTRGEQVDYLNTIQAYALASRVRITRWTNFAPLAPQTTSGGLRPAAMPKGVVAVPSAVEVAGSYANVRAFLYYLQRSPRLFSLNDFKWSRGDKWPSTTVAFTLTRYLKVNTPPVSVGATDASATPPAGSVQGGAAPGVPTPVNASTVPPPQ